MKCIPDVSFSTSSTSSMHRSMCVPIVPQSHRKPIIVVDCNNEATHRRCQLQPVSSNAPYIIVVVVVQRVSSTMFVATMHRTSSLLCTVSTHRRRMIRSSHLLRVPFRVRVCTVSRPVSHPVSSCAGPFRARPVSPVSRDTEFGTLIILSFGPFLFFVLFCRFGGPF